MAVMEYDPNADVTYAKSVNVIAGSPYDTFEPQSEEDDMTEALCRERYPLLCERFLDGYTEAQVARGHRTSVTAIRARIGAESARAALDPQLKSGLGRALVTGARR